METQIEVFVLAILATLQSFIFFIFLNKKQPNYDLLTNFYKAAISFGLIGIPLLFLEISIGCYFIISGIIFFIQCSIFQSIATKKDEGYIE